MYAEFLCGNPQGNIEKEMGA